MPRNDDNYGGPLPSTAPPAPPTQQLPSLQEILASLQGSLNFGDPEAMAAADFAPQYSALDKIVAQAQQRYDVANRDIGSMYEGLAQATLGRLPEVKQRYAETDTSLDSAYKDAMNSVSGSFQKSTNDITELMNRLGIQQAAPTVLGNSKTELVNAIADLAKRSQGNRQLNTALGNNEQSYLGKTADTNRLAGKNAQADLLKHLQDIQAQNDQKRLSIDSERAQAANSYRNQFQKLIADQQQNAIDTYQKERQWQLSNRNADLAEGRLALDTQKYTSGLEQTDYLNSLKQSSDPVDSLSNMAIRVYSDPQDAANASQAILNTYSSGDYVSLGQFLQDVNNISNDALERQRLQQLAISFYTKLKS